MGRITIREKLRAYQGDVEYEVWRQGGNPDLVDRDRVRDDFDGGEYHEDTAHRELKRQRRKDDHEG